MAEARRHDTAPRHTYDQHEMNVRLLGLGALSLVLLLGGGLALMVWVFAVFDPRPAGPGQQTAPVAEAPPRLPAPRLQTSPRQDMQTLRTAEKAHLQSYGWVDRDAGIARIPLDQAVELVLQQGLPAWPAEAGHTTEGGATTETGR